MSPPVLYFLFWRYNKVKYLLKLCSRFIDIIERFSNLIGGWLIVFLMALVAADVAYRYIVNKSIAGAYSLSEIVMVGICFLSMAYTQKEKGHVAVDFVVHRLKGSASQFLEFISSLLSLIISILLFYRSAAEAHLAVKIRLVTSGIIEWPAWPLKIVVAFGFLLLSIRIAIQLNQQIQLIIAKRGNHVT